MLLFDDTLATVTSRARRFGGKTALVCGEMRLSFVALDDRAARFAARLAQRGIGKGVVVTLYGPVGWEWVVAYHAILRTGAVINPVNALLSPEEVRFILEDSGARLIVADSGRLTSLKPLAIESIALEDLDRLSADGPIVEPAAAVADEFSTICYTSGTTGRPKGAMLSHRNVLMNTGLTALMHGRTADDVIVSALPLAHVYGNVVMNAALVVGATLVLVAPFSAAAVLTAIEANRATRFDGVPTMYYFLLEAPELAGTDLSSLRLCHVGGQTMPDEKMGAVERTFGCPLLELWGMSEIAGLGTTFPWTGPRTLGSIGVALPGVRLRTVDVETGEPTAPDAPGELQIRGPLVMMGYLNNEAATREVLDAEGWLATGDVARIDVDGNVFIVDRKKDMILTSGNNVYPAELERVIAMHQAVAMVAVGRDPHPTKGEVPHAYIVRKRGADASEAAIIDHCRAHLAPYKIPRAVTFVADLPRNSTGKILRRALGAQLEPAE